MYAIVEIAGQQFKVEKGRKLYVHRLANPEGSAVSFDNVLLIDNDGKVEVGAPSIKDASVEAKVIKHLKDDKVLVFKKRRRKGYQKMNGHRQYLSQIEITGIGAKSSAPKAAPAPKPAEPKAEAAPAAAPKAEKPAAPKAAAPKAEAKPAAAKKPAAKKEE